MNRIKKVQVETIRDCSGQCIICNYRDKGRDEKPKKMTGEVFRTIISKIKELPCLETVCLYGHNEPLLDKSIFNRIRYIKKRIPHARIELSTNGILLPPVFGEFCSLADDRWISFHGISEKTYEKNMGLPWLVGRTVRELIKNQLGKRFVISVGLIDFVKEEVKEFWKDFDNVKIMSFVPRDRCGNIKGKHVKSFNKPPTKNFSCWRFNKFLAFDVDGNLIPCSNDLESKEIIGDYKQDMGQIEHGRDYFKDLNRIGHKTICWRCGDHGDKINAGESSNS